MNLINTVRKNTENIIRLLINGTFENIKSRKVKILNNYSLTPIAKDLYVSFTTYGPRLDVFEYTVLSILAGSLLPEKILIYVPRGFYNLLLENANSFLKNYLNNGLIEIIEMDLDLGCHSKYYYSFKSFGSIKDIVICDDDVVYYDNWLRDIVNASKKSPEYDVFAFRAVQVYRDEENILPYDQWLHLSNGNKSEFSIYAEGVGGVLFRKGKLTGEVFNREVFLKITPKADDVWLWFCTHYANLKVKFISTSNSSKLLYVIPGSQVVNLWSDNTILKRNDRYVAECHAYFKEKLGFDIIENLPFLKK